MNMLTALYIMLIRPLELLFEFIYVIANRIIQNPGMSIIALSLAMNFLVLPLYRQADEMQAREQETEKRLNPWITKIKKTFKGDERFYMLQEYYRQNDYKPYYALRGSFSLLLEVPFFIAAYRFLFNLDIIKGISFGPIKDLGAPDGMLVIGGLAINVLPILMTTINIISGAVYTKGMPLKSKIQINVMALIFLVFLYKSPAGLVFYWTLNNVFSLVKNIFYKLKKPGKVLSILVSGVGLLSIIFFGGFYTKHLLKRRLFFIATGILMQLPLIICILKEKKAGGNKEAKAGAKADRKLFWLAALVCTVLVGIVIPMTVIESSPAEFIDIAHFGNPIGYLWYSGLLAFGTFVIWVGIFYGLASEKGKEVMGKLYWAIACVFIFDFMVFGAGYGNISASFQYDNDPVVSLKKQMINFAAIIAIVLVAYLIATKLGKLAGFIGLVGLSTLVVMGTMSIVKTNKALNTEYKYIKDQAESLKEMNDNGLIHLNKEGKNVVVIMLDRAMGCYIPYIMDEKPELKEKFDGFTYYRNVMSFGRITIYGAPSLMGGYEYTPAAFNERSDEAFVKKHNESNLLMPVIFSENGFDVGVCEAPLAGCEYIPNMTIYDDYPGIKTYLINKRLNSIENDASDVTEKMRARNFFCYSLYKVAPLVLQETMYNGGVYNEANAQDGIKNMLVQVRTSLSEAYGIESTFANTYAVMKNLPSLTRVEESGTNTFMFMANEMTHQITMLQKPDYELAEVVDNRPYDDDLQTRYVIDGVRMKMTTPNKVAHYDSNMSAMIQLAKWFDYLRENGVYDNTRIILVSDHGTGGGQFESMIFNKDFDVQEAACLLMVKDFDAKGFTTSGEFMTNADVPTLAMADLISNPVNPFTGKAINSDAKYDHDQKFINSKKAMTEFKDGNTYPKSKWYSFNGTEVYDKNNWTYDGEY